MTQFTHTLAQFTQCTHAMTQFTHTLAQFTQCSHAMTQFTHTMTQFSHTLALMLFAHLKLTLAFASVYG